MEFFENIGRNIMYILEQQNKTQVSLAEQIGVSRQVMQKITKGKKAINALEISQIASALHVPIKTITRKSASLKEGDPLVMFMGEIKNSHVRENFDFLNGIIDEIVHLEEDLNELSQK